MFSNNSDSSDSGEEEDDDIVDQLQRLSFDKESEHVEEYSIREFNAADNANSPSASPSPPSMTRVGLKDFELKSVIGQGAYGKVFLVQSKRSRSTNKLFAMKVLRKATLVIHQKETEHTWNERKILQAISHPFIVKLFYAFQTSFKLYLILGYAPGGELFNYLYKEKMFKEESVVFYSAELLLALQHLHSLGIIYRDLKPENVLLGNDGHILLTDFGLSKVSLDGARTICGTTEFLAPEVILLDQYNEKVKAGQTMSSAESPSYTYLVDYWSLGIMIFDMLNGHPPFTGNNNKKVMDAIIKKKLVCPNYMTAAAKDLCSKLLKKHPNVRLGAGETGPEQIRAHPFYRKIKNWQDVFDKKLRPPIIPTLDDTNDTSNFDESFTKMPVNDTPPDESGGGVCQCESKDQGKTCDAEECTKDPFTGFSYVHEDIEDMKNEF